MPAIGARTRGGSIRRGPRLSIEADNLNLRRTLQAAGFAWIGFASGFDQASFQEVVECRPRPWRCPREDSALWIHNRRFDLLFLTLSGVLVFLPYLSYGLLQKVGALARRRRA